MHLTQVYKIDTTQTGDAVVAGAYPSRPSVAAGNPVPFAVLSNGDAYVSPPVSVLPFGSMLTAVVSLADLAPFSCDLSALHSLLPQPWPQMVASSLR